MPVSTKFLKIVDKGYTIDLQPNLIIRVDISSCPCALFVLRALKIVNITFSLKQNEQSLAIEIYCGELGTVMLLTRKEAASEGVL